MSWKILRQDDNGNVLEVAQRTTEQEASDLVKEYEKKGHKQTYWMEAMNKNVIVTNAFSNPASEKLYKDGWPDAPELKEQYEDGKQCGGCNLYAKLNSDYGLCINSGSRHHLETVFEHFTCPALKWVGWNRNPFDVTLEDIL